MPPTRVFGAAGLHARHAGVVHAEDAGADDEPCERDRRGRAAAEVEDDEAEAHDEDAEKRRDQRHERVVVERDRQLQAEHRHEVHRPDAAAEGEGGHGDAQLALGRRHVGKAARHRQAREPGHERDREGGDHEPRVMRVVERHGLCPSPWLGLSGVGPDLGRSRAGEACSAWTAGDGAAGAGQAVPVAAFTPRPPRPRPTSLRRSGDERTRRDPPPSDGSRHRSSLPPTVR